MAFTDDAYEEKEVSEEVLEEALGKDEDDEEDGVPEAEEDKWA